MTYIILCVLYFMNSGSTESKIDYIATELKHKQKQLLKLLD